MSTSAEFHPQHIGYWLDGTDWTPLSCSGSNEYYHEISTYFACHTFITACTNAAVTGYQTSESGIDYCTGDDYACITQTLHSSFPALASDPGQKLKPVCAPTGWSTITELYRIYPEPSPVTNTQPPEISSALGYVSSSHITAAPTSAPPSTSLIPPPQESQPQTTNVGVIAGAAVGGAALLLVVSFLIWFFGFHRRKVSQPPAYQPPQIWQQPDMMQSYGVAAGRVPASPDYEFGYANVQQNHQGAGKLQGTNNVSELAADQHGRR